MDDFQGRHAPKKSWEVSDGFGMRVMRCGPECDLHVVRPGKVQCNATDSECPNQPKAAA